MGAMPAATVGLPQAQAAEPLKVTPVVCNQLVAGMTRRTSSFTLSCRDRVDVLSRLAWTSWRKADATGHGTLTYTNCEPKCAAGERRTTHATVRLSQPVEGQGGRVFTRVRVTFTDAVGNRVVKVYRAVATGGTRGAARR